MRKIYQFALSLAATCLVASTALAQSARVVDLGANSYTNSVWYDSTNDVAWVAGADTAGVNSPTMWSIDEVDIVTANALQSLQPGSEGAVAAISRNGQYVTGSTVSAETDPSFEATLWVFGQWNNPQPIGYVSGGLATSEGRGVTNVGRVAGLSSGGFPFSKDIGQTIQQLAALPGGTGAGTVDGISADGEMCIGNAQNAAYSFVATAWTNGGATATALDDPYALFSAAAAVSPDGSLVGGLATDMTGTGASAWIDGTLTFINDDTGQKFFGQANAVTDDGMFVGSGLFGGVTQTAFVWHTSWPNAMTMEAWLQQNGVSSPPTLTEVRDIYHDGSTYHFAVEGATSSYYIQTDDVDGEPEPTFDLNATPNPVQAGQWVSFKLTGGTPGYPGIMLQTKRNGNPLRILAIVGIGFFNSNGEITFNRWMPWWFHGTKTYQGITAEQGYTQLLYTPEMDLVIQ